MISTSARVALVLVAVSAGLGFAGCSRLDELRDTISGRFPTGEVLGENEGVHPEDMPEPSRVVPPEKIPGASKASKKQDTTRKAQRPQTVEPANKLPVSVSPEPVSSKKVDSQSTSSQTTPLRLRTLGLKRQHPKLFHTEIDRPAVFWGVLAILACLSPCGLRFSLRHHVSNAHVPLPEPTRWRKSGQAGETGPRSGLFVTA